jgi:hypothetical protein
MKIANLAIAAVGLVAAAPAVAAANLRDYANADDKAEPARVLKSGNSGNSVSSGGCKPEDYEGTCNGHLRLIICSPCNSWSLTLLACFLPSFLVY